MVSTIRSAGDSSEARKLVDELRLSGLRPLNDTYITLCKGCFKVGDLESTMGIMEEMKRERIELNGVVFMAVISGLYGKGRVAYAERIPREMFSAGVKPDDR